MLPLYLEQMNLYELQQRAEELKDMLAECTVCPRNCLAKRTSGKYGVCRSTDEIFISNAGPHFGEEPPLVGLYGSGTIFFTNCNLCCQFCQNFDISHLRNGYKITSNDLAQIMIDLQNKGCHNINLVTPTHYTPQIMEALIAAIENGLEIPLVYNCGGYESLQTLKLLENIIDIYMPDIKYSDDENARKYSGVINYWQTVTEAVKEMFRQVGNLKTNRKGIAERGLIIRHLVLPNGIGGSKKIVDFVAGEISSDSYINIMDQYHPAYRAYKHKELNRRITAPEYSEVIEYAFQNGLYNGIK
jgi:putative pyruvate formate lyase activating enzyme